MLSRVLVLAVAMASLNAHAWFSFDPKVKTCQTQLQSGTNEVNATVKKASDAGTLSQAELTRMNQMTDNLNRLSNALYQPNATLANCTAALREMETARTQANAFAASAAKGNPVAPCLATLRAVNQDINTTVQQARAAGNLSPAEQSELKQLADAQTQLRQEMEKGGLTIIECNQLTTRQAALQSRVKAMAASAKAPPDPRLAECRAKLAPMREEIASTVQQAVTARQLPAAQIEQMKQLGTSASQWMQEAAKSGLTLTECEATAKQLADAQAKIRAFPKPDPKLAECRAKLAPARDQIAATIKKVTDAGNPSPAHLEEMKRMGELSALLLENAQKDGFSLADCEAAAKRLADQQVRANQFAALGAQLAQCRTTANATYQEMTRLFQQAQTSKTVNPRESFQLQRSRQNIEQTLAAVRKDGITLEECQQNIALLNNEMGIIREAMRPDVDVCRQSLNALDGQLRAAVDKLKAMRPQISAVDQTIRADSIIFDHQICCFTSPGEAIPLPACRARLDQTERVWERIRTQFPNTAY